ncbi:MAG: hypothetical protein J6I96_04665 [Oscillospiraceae bacterium]|nr:hypothetical protein [Oscillospiraceae bacterium]
MKRTKIRILAAVMASGIACIPMNVSAETAVSKADTAVKQDTAKAESVKYGKVTSVSGTKVKLSLGTFGTKKVDNGNAPASKDTPPDMNGKRPERQGGKGGQPPQMPSGNMGKDRMQDKNGRPDMERRSGTNGTFTANGESIVIDLSGAALTKNGEKASVSDIVKDDILTLVYDGSDIKEVRIGADTDRPDMIKDKNGKGSKKDTKSKAASSEVKGRYTAKGKSLSASSKTLKSTDEDTSVVMASDSGKFIVKSSKLYKTGDTTSEDGSNFYGLNAAVLADNGTVDISDSYVYTDADGANAVFAAGESASVTVKDTTVITKNDSSRGLDATLGGTVTAENVKIKTEGAHCAPLATDRGGGTVSAVSSVLISSGEGSPCIYSTGDITAVNCKGQATGAQTAVVEGKNSITLESSSLTGAGKNGVMLYQSTSGDAEEGTAVFTAKNSTLRTTSTGPMFYITNTDAVIDLTNTKLVFGSGILIDAAGNSTNNWGTPGKNGGSVAVRAAKQTLDGSITCDEISSVSLSLTSSSVFTGAVDTADTGDVSVSLDGTSVWNVTADSYVTVLNNTDADYSNIRSNGHTIYYSKASNPALGGKTVALSGGGKLSPV